MSRIKVIFKGIYRIWMKIAHILGWVNTRILLTLLFYLVMAPIGMFARIMRRDFLDLRINKDKDSYWLNRPQKILELKQYEKQF